MDLLYFVVLIGSLIFVHELGHFLFAKAFGVIFLGEPRGEHSQHAHEAPAAMRGATPKHVARSKTPAERLRIRSHNPRAKAAAFLHGPASTYQTTAFDATPSRVSSLSR